MGQGSFKKKHGPKPGEKIKTVETESQASSGKRKEQLIAVAAANKKKGASSSKAASATASSEPAAALSAAFEPLSAPGGATDYSDAEMEDPAPKAMLLDPAATAALQREVRAAKRGGVKPTPEGAAVLYLGHIPHGFYEEQMRGFFAQFGTVSRLRLARNKKTGRSKHYAFIEFKDAEVGGIVAKAMDGYLLYSKILVAKVLPPESVHPETFKGANRPFRVIDTAAAKRKQHNKPRTAEEAEKREKRLVQAEQRKRKKLEAAGIDYEFGGYEAEAAQPKKRVRGVLTSEAPLVDDKEEAVLKAPRKLSAREIEAEEAPPAEAQKPKEKKRKPQSDAASADAEAPAPPPKKKGKKQKGV